MAAKIWHAKNPTFGMELPGRPTPVFPQDYEMVAEVECTNLGEAYALTNSITEEWTKNPEVRATGRHRSTSVGDVVEIHNLFYLCCSLGWKEISG